MKKITYKEKLKIVKENQEGYAREYLSKKYGISEHTIQNRIQSYRILGEEGFKKSITDNSYKGNCLDNSLMENFFGLLKQEMFYCEDYKTIEELEAAIREYIDWYNNKRIKTKLNGLSPVEYRLQAVW